MRGPSIYLLPGAMLALACLMGAQPAPPEQARPNWTVGDTWKVGTWYGQAYLPTRSRPSVLQNARGQMIVVTFEVKAVTAVADRECYEIEVRYPPEQTGFERCYRLYYCRQSARLVRSLDISLLPDGQRRHVATDYPVDAEGPTLVEDLPGLIPFDWPDRTGRQAAPRQKNDAAPQQTLIAASVREADGTQQTEEQIVLSEPAGRRKQVVQRWRPGERWWREARKYENGRLVSEALLLEVNGQELKQPRQSTKAN